MQWSLRISSCVPLPSQEPRNQAGGSPCPLLIPCRGRGLDSLFLSQIIPFDYLNLPILLRPIFLTPLLRRGVKKSGYFTVRLTVRGGRGSATSALTISKWVWGVILETFSACQLKDILLYFPLEI